MQVAVPQNLSAEAREALKTYADHTNDHDPRKDLYSMAGVKAPASTEGS
jgi:hypothetical protein